MTRSAVIALVLLAAAGPARAHNLGATADVRGGHVEVEAYFSDDTPARDAKVTVRDAADAVLVAGRTDDAGRWRFPVPPDGVYRVVVDAGGGHRKPFTVRIKDGAVASDQPPRAEFTRFPWGGIAAGLTVIVLLAVGWRAWRGGSPRRNWGHKSDSGPHDPSQPRSGGG